MQAQKRKPPALPKRVNTPNPIQKTNDIICDALYENQRGLLWFGRPKFAQRSLLPSDPAGWSKEDGSFAVELRLYQCPPAYEWISEWMIDMNGPVDAEGWMYADQFYTDTTLYQAQMNDAHHVRRRRWIRMRRNITTPLKQEPTTPRDIESIISQMRSKRMDRERLEALAKWLKLGTLKPALVSLFKTGTLDHGRVGS